MGAFLTPPSNVVSRAITFNVASVSDFISAWSKTSLLTLTETGSITIKFADGTYNFGTDQFILNHPSGGQIQIIGNTTTPANVILNFSGPSVPFTGNVQPSWGAFGVTNGNKIGLIDGFTMNGPGMANPSGFGFLGILAYNGATILCGPHLILNNFYSGLAAFFGSSIWADGGIKVTGGGDGNIWAYGNSVISCVGCESSGAGTYFSESGILVDNHSYVFARNSNIHDNGINAVTIVTSSSISLAGASLTNSQIGINSASGTGNSYEGPTTNTCTTPVQAAESMTGEAVFGTVFMTFDGATFTANSNVQQAIVTNRNYLGVWLQNGTTTNLLSINANGQPCFGGSTPTTPGVNFWTVSNHVIRFGTNGALVLTMETDQSCTFAAGVNMAAIPTSDPHVVGQLWNSSGTMKISAG